MATKEEVVVSAEAAAATSEAEEEKKEVTFSSLVSDFSYVYFIFSFKYHVCPQSLHAAFSSSTFNILGMSLAEFSPRICFTICSVAEARFTRCIQENALAQC